MPQRLAPPRLVKVVSATVAITYLPAFAAAQPAKPMPTPAPAPVAPAPAPALNTSEPTAPPAASAPQSAPVSKLNICARVGVNFASALEETDEGLITSRTGLAVCGFARYALSDVLGAEIGVGYSQRGYERAADFFEVSGESVELDYFEVPTTLGAKFKLGESAFGRAFGGINVLVLDAARSTNDFGQTQSIEDLTTDYDIALIGGAGVDIKFGDLLMLAEFRYDIGLVDTIEEDSEQFREIKNRVGSLMVGVAF